MATVDFKRLALSFLFLTTLFTFNQASRVISDLGEIIVSGSKLKIDPCLPAQCKGIGKYWCCIWVKTDQNCSKEKDVCISLCPKQPPQRAYYLFCRRN
ncbi:hypothetical protein MKX01_018524 [Papaver californicum]|nr:hypothetical protein MKX01_018524 [Papaver californicum]